MKILIKNHTYNSKCIHKNFSVAILSGVLCITTFASANDYTFSGINRLIYENNAFRHTSSQNIYTFDKNKSIRLGDGLSFGDISLQFNDANSEGKFNIEMNEVLFSNTRSVFSISNHTENGIALNINKVIVDTAQNDPFGNIATVSFTDGSKHDKTRSHSTTIKVGEVDIRSRSHLLLAPTNQDTAFDFNQLKIRPEALISIRLDWITKEKFKVDSLYLDNGSIDSWTMVAQERWSNAPFIDLQKAYILGNTASDIPLKNNGVFIVEGNLGLSSLRKADGHSATIINAGKMYIGQDLAQATSTHTQPNFSTFTLPTYIGNTGGEIYIGAELKEGGNHDQLIITEKASGTSKVVVQSVGGIEKSITNGLVLVKFIGDEENNTLKLTLQKPVTDGLYSYDLRLKNAEWLLTNDGPNGKNYSTQPNAYLAAQAVSNEMFNHRYHDRVYNSNNDGIWTSITGSFSKFKSTLTGDISSKTNRATIYLGKDLVSNNNYVSGLMAAYGYASGKTENHNGFSAAEKTDYKSNGLAIGLYGTYTFAPHSYIDAWAQYAFVRNELTWGHNSEKYNAKGIVVSIEAAYALNLADSVYFQPQAQLTYMGIKSDDLKIGGYTYKSDHGNVQIRLGGRLFGENIFADSTGSPYVEANYLRNTKEYKVTAKNIGEALSFKLDGAKNLFQVKFGSDFNFNNNAKIDLHVSHTFGKKSYRDTRLNVNFRYNF